MKTAKEKEIDAYKEIKPKGRRYPKVLKSV